MKNYFKSKVKTRNNNCFEYNFFGLILKSVEFLFITYLLFLLLFINF